MDWITVVSQSGTTLNVEVYTSTLRTTPTNFYIACTKDTVEAPPSIVFSEALSVQVLSGSLQSPNIMVEDPSFANTMVHTFEMMAGLTT